MTFERWEHRELQGLVGRTITAVRLLEAGEAIEFETDAGPQKYAAEGGCCSSSWIEHIGDYAQIIGSPVVSVEAGDGADDPTAHDRDCEQRDKPRPTTWTYEGPECYCDCVRVYQYVIQTAKGQMAVEMRNSSNGYYGGSLERVS